MARTQATIDRKLKKKVDTALAGTSCRGRSTLIEMLFDEIVRVARKCLEMRDDGLDTTHRLDYIRAVGTLDGLVWSYCFCWVNAYEPHFTEARERIRRQAIKQARKEIEEES
jgi:hypothetical protein